MKISNKKFASLKPRVWQTLHRVATYLLSTYGAPFALTLIHLVGPMKF